jgi:hypothetical protein
MLSDNGICIVICAVTRRFVQVFLAEQRYSEAEVAARSAVRSFEKAGRQCFLAEALITCGLAMARLGKIVRAQFTFQKAIEVAHQAGSLNVAGLAALTLIEEVDNLAPEILSSAYEQAKDWLASCQSEDIEPRLKAANRKLILQSGTRPENVGRPEILFNKQYHLPKEVLNFERGLIKDTLTKVNGSITHAARLLGVSYQRLAYIIETRHKDLLKERSPVRRRGGKGTQ